MPNSLARKRARAVARTINAGRGKVSRPSGSARRPITDLMRGRSLPAKGAKICDVGLTRVIRHDPAGAVRCRVEEASPNGWPRT